MKISITAIVAALMVSLATFAFSHPGHGSPEWAGTMAHYLVEFMHLPLIAMMSVFAVITFRWAFLADETAEEAIQDNED